MTGRLDHLQAAVEHLVGYAGGLEAFLAGLRTPGGDLDLLDKTGAPVLFLDPAEVEHLRGEPVRVRLVCRMGAARSAWIHAARYSHGQGTLMQPLDCQRRRMPHPLWVSEGEQLELEVYA